MAASPSDSGVSIDTVYEDRDAWNQSKLSAYDFRSKNTSTGHQKQSANILLKATLQFPPRNGLDLTVEDIERKIVLSDGADCCTCPTRLVHLENPLGGFVMPLTELRRIYGYAQRNGLKVHMDGARLWEAVAAGHGSLREFCAAVDSVNLCLTKGLGASVGAVVVGDAEFIRHVRWVRKALGGGMRQPGIVAAAAWAAIEEASWRENRPYSV